jgi:hypothetical protein
MYLHTICTSKFCCALEILTQKKNASHMFSTQSYLPFEKWSQLHQLFPISSMYCFSLLLLNLLSESWNSKKSTFHQDLCAIQILTKKPTKWTHNPDSGTETIEDGSKKQLLIRPMIHRLSYRSNLKTNEPKRQQLCTSNQVHNTKILLPATGLVASLFTLKP